MWESRVLRRAFERLELHEGKLSRAVLRGGGGGDVTSLPDAGVGNHRGLPGPEFRAQEPPFESAPSLSLPISTAMACSTSSRLTRRASSSSNRFARLSDGRKQHRVGRRTGAG